MEALRTHHIGEGGDMHMESALTDIDGKIGRDVKEVYVGPSALWIRKAGPPPIPCRRCGRVDWHAPNPAAYGRHPPLYPWHVAARLG